MTTSARPTPIPPYDFQRDATDRLAKQAGYLAFDMGLGKSRVALDVAAQRGAKHILVICPMTLTLTWEKEAARWAPDLQVYRVNAKTTVPDLARPGLHVVTYGLMSRGESALITALKASRFDMTILDEAQALKNGGAMRTRVVLVKLIKSLGHVLPMSGTPMPNHAGELYPILRTLFPDTIRIGEGGPVMDKTFYTLNFVETETRLFNGRRVEITTGSKNLSELRERIKGVFIRKTRKQALASLPPLNVQTIPIEGVVPGDPALDGLTGDAILAAVQNLGYDHVMRVRRMLGLGKVDSAAVYVSEVLDEQLPPDEKILIFAHHRQVIQRAETLLAKYSPAVITGENTLSERAAALDKFLTDDSCRVFIGNIQACGTGLTLFGPKAICRRSYFIETSFSPGDNTQAACRILRIGQTGPVDANFFYVPGTYDEAIQAILAQKSAAIETVGL